LNVAPDTVSDDAARPVKPESVLLALSVSVPDVLRVPVPDSVPPVSVMLPPLLAFGLAPNGRLQVVAVLVPAVCVKVTRLNVFTEHARVAVVAPLKSTVPPSALNVGAPEIVNAPATCMVPDGAVNEPLERVNAALTVKVV
jgi:hypothetical protein